MTVVKHVRHQPMGQKQGQESQDHLRPSSSFISMLQLQPAVLLSALTTKSTQRQEQGEHHIFQQDEDGLGGEGGWADCMSSVYKEEY